MLAQTQSPQLSEPKAPQHTRHQHHCKASPKHCAVAEHQGLGCCLRWIVRGFGYRRRYDSHDGQTEGGAELSDRVEDRAGEGMSFRRKDVDNNKVSDGEDN